MKTINKEMYQALENAIIVNTAALTVWQCSKL